MEKKTTRHWFSWQNFNQVLDRKKPYYRKPVHTVPCVPGYEGTEAWNLLFLVVLRWGVEKVCIFSGSKTAFLGKPNCFFLKPKKMFFLLKTKSVLCLDSDLVWVAFLLWAMAGAQPR